MGVTVDVGQVSVHDVEGLGERLVEFMGPYQERVGWVSREKHLGTFAGLVGGTERKSVEPIALARCPSEAQSGREAVVGAALNP